MPPDDASATTPAGPSKSVASAPLRSAEASERTHPTLELLSTISALGGSILIGVGAIGALTAPDYARVGLSVLVVGLLLFVAVPLASYPLTTLRVRMAEESGGRSYDVLRGWQRLKVAGLLLNLLTVAAAMLLLLALLGRVGIVAADLDPALLDRVLILMTAAVAGAGAYALHHSLRTPRDLDRSGPNTAIMATAVTGAVACALLAAVAQLGKGATLAAHLGADDVPMLALAALAATAYALFRTRNLPNLSILLSENKAAYDGRGTGSRNRSVVLPAILAFALMLIVFLLFLLFGIGVATILSEVGRSPFLLGLLLFLVAAIIITLALAFSLTRSSDAPNALYKVLVTKAHRRRILIITSSAIAAAIFLIPAGLAFYGGALGVPKSAAMHFLCLAILSAVGPYGFYMSREHNRVHRLEDRFPDFLRDIASSHKGGLTLHQAVTIAARGEYGPLTPEVRKMADQLSWNVSFSEALVQFADRVDTPLVERAVNLILQADRSGGSTTDILLAASRDAREIKNLENERRLTMSLYTVVIYITFFVFLSVAAVLYSQFVPQLVAASEATAGEGALAGGFAGGKTTLTLADYQLFYFLAAVVQGLGDGIVAGLMGTGRAVLGLRHSFIMVAISYITFALFLV